MQLSPGKDNESACLSVWRRGEEKCMSGEMEPGQRVLQGSVLSRKVSPQAILKLNGIVFGRRDWGCVGRILVSSSFLP